MKSLFNPTVFTTIAMALLAVVGLTSRLRSDDAATDKRQKAIAALNTAREEFVNLFITEEKQVLSEMFLAEQSQKAARQTQESAKALAEKRIVTSAQVESAAQATQDAEKRLDVAKDKLTSLRKSHRQVLAQFDQLEKVIDQLKGQ